MKKIFIITQPEVTYWTGGAITAFIDMCNMFSKIYEVSGFAYAPKNIRPQGLNEKVNFINLKFIYKNNTKKININLNKEKSKESKEKIEKEQFSQNLNQYLHENKPDLIIFYFPDLFADAKLEKTFDKIPKILMFHERPDLRFAQDIELEENIKLFYKNTITHILLPNYFKLLPRFMQEGKVVSIANFCPEVKEFVDMDKEKKKIIYLSRIDAFKGLESLIDAFRQIAYKYKEWQLHIYGASTPYYKEALREYIKALNLEQQIFFKGVSKEPLKTMLDYDFCVFPSYMEGLPIGLLEALATGLPSIGFKGCTGVNTLIRDNQNGFLVDEDTLQFAQKIELLIQDKSLRKTMSLEAKKTALIYNKKDIDKKWFDLIDEILQGKFKQENFNKLPVIYKPFPISYVITLPRILPIYTSMFRRLGACERVKYSLPYKLGQAILNAKTPRKILILPFVLIFLPLRHLMDDIIYNSITRINPHFKIPPLKYYFDYRQSLETKRHLSYQLGLAWLRNPLTFPFKIIKIYKKFKNKGKR